MNNEKELLDSLINDPRLGEIERLFAEKEPNIFKVLRLEGNEIRHSNFLGWLLDSRGSHGLGAEFVKKILVEVGMNVDELKCDDVVVEREKNHIDVLVYSPTEKWCLVIENKTWTKDHDNQLNRYSEDVKQLFKDYYHLFVYLTPTGEEPIQNTNDYWKCVGYKFIKDKLQKMLNEANVNNRAKIFIEDYIKLLEEDLLMENDKGRRDLCIEFYNDHKEAIDLINKYIGDTGAMRTKLYYDRLDEYKDSLGISMGVSTNKYTRFIPNLLKEKVSGQGNGWSDKNDYLILYEVQTDKYTDQLRMQIVLGPSVDNVKKEELLKELSKDKLFGNAKATKRVIKRQKYDTAYIWIYEHQIINKSDYKTLSEEKAAGRLIEFIKSKEFANISNKLLEIINKVYR